MYVRIEGYLVRVFLHTQLYSRFSWYLVHCPERYPEVVAHARMGSYSPEEETLFYEDLTASFNSDVTDTSGPVFWISSNHVEELKILRNKDVKILLKKH